LRRSSRFYTLRRSSRFTYRHVFRFTYRHVFRFTMPPRVFSTFHQTFSIRPRLTLVHAANQTLDLKTRFSHAGLHFFVNYKKLLGTWQLFQPTLVEDNFRS
jgi:hypothetical protein